MERVAVEEMEKTYHMSIGVEYSVEPRRTSGGRYQSVTTSFEYVFVGTDLARARPKSASCTVKALIDHEVKFSLFFYQQQHKLSLWKGSKVSKW